VEDDVEPSSCSDGAEDGGVGAVGGEDFMVDGHEESAGRRGGEDGAFDFVGGRDIEEVDVLDRDNAREGHRGVDAQRLPDSDASEVDGAVAGSVARGIGGRRGVEGGGGADDSGESDAGVILKGDGTAADGCDLANKVFDGVEGAGGLAGAR